MAASRLRRRLIDDFLLVHNNVLGGPAATYADKVLGYSPIAYWPLWEASGSDAVCQVNAAQNGTYSGVTLGQTGIGDGKTCPLYDGTNDHTDIYSVTLNTNFDGAEGTVMVWAKVSGAGVWTDGAQRQMIKLEVDEQNWLLIQKDNNNNRIDYRYEAGNVGEARSRTGSNETAWMCLAMTWSASNDRNISYFNGVQVEGARTGLGVWAGNLSNGDCCIGADNTANNEPWDGYLAHAAVWDSELSAADLLDLATV